MPAVLFLAAEGPVAEVSNISLKDFIGKTLVQNKQMFFPLVVAFRMSRTAN
jgi:hypothetical protein